MPEADWIKLAAAYARSNDQMAADVLAIWKHGSTNPGLISIDFCAADFVLEVMPS